jgi:hypothetical protein
MQIAYALTESDFTESYSVHRNSKTWRKWSRRIFICIAGLFTAIIFFGFLVKPSLQQAKGLAPFFVLVAMWAGILWLPTIACFLGLCARPKNNGSYIASPEP